MNVQELVEMNLYSLLTGNFGGFFSIEQELRMRQKLTLNLKH